MIRPLEALIQQLRVQAPLGGALGDQAAQRFGLKVVRTGTARKNAPFSTSCKPRSLTRR